MGRDLGTMTLNEFTSELSSLVLKRTARSGLSSVEADRLREMKRALRPHAGPAGSPEERRQFLRLEVVAAVVLRGANENDVPRRLRCTELGVGGLVLESSPLLALEERFHIERIVVGDESLRLDVAAVAVRRGELDAADEAPGDKSVALRFAALDVGALTRIRTAFEHVFERAARSPGAAARMAGRDPLILDVGRLGRICNILTRFAGLGHGWSAKGPSSEICTLLTANGRPLPVSNRVLVLLAWRLWTGICDVRSTEFWHLGADVQAVVADLMHAVRLGPREIDAWMDKYEPTGTYGLFSQ